MTKNETKTSDVVEAHEEPVKPRKSKSKKASWAPLLVFVAFLVGMLVMTLVQAQRPQNLGSDASEGVNCTALSLSRCTAGENGQYCELRDTGSDVTRSCSSLTQESCMRRDGCQPKSCTDFSYDNCPTSCDKTAWRTCVGTTPEYLGCKGNYTTDLYVCDYKPGAPAPTNKPAATATPRPTSRPVPTTPPSSYCENLEPSMCTPSNGCKLIGSDCVPAPQPTSTPRPGGPTSTPRPGTPTNPPGQPVPTTPSGGSTSSAVRVSGKVVSCSNQPVANATVTMYDRNTATPLVTVKTDSQGMYNIVRSYKSSMGSAWFSVMAGRDANRTSREPYYGRRLASPKFIDVSGQRRDCSTINCNYTGNQVAGGAYRENYVPGWNWSTSDFMSTFVHSTNSFQGMDFKEVGCPLPTLTPPPVNTPVPTTFPPRAQITSPTWSSNWSLSKLQSDPSLSVIKLYASGDPNKAYDIIAYIYEVPWSANTNVWAAVTEGNTFSCSATQWPDKSSKWSEISRTRVSKGYFSLRSRRTIDLPAITQQKWDQAIENGLQVEVGKRYLITVNVVATDFRTAGNNSFCTGNPAISTTNGPCWGTNWCNSQNNRSSGGMFQVVNLTW